MSRSVSHGRRRFLAACSLVPMCALGGCRRAQAAVQAGPAEAAGHKFQASSEMSFEQVFRFGFRPFAGILRVLAAEPGYERVLEILPQVSSKLFAENTRRRKSPDRSLESLIGYLRTPDRFWKHVVSTEIVEDSPGAFAIKVSECLWARTFREIDAAEIGYACICHPDFASASAFNPQIKLERTKTLMQGHDCCNHRWVMDRARA